MKWIGLVFLAVFSPILDVSFGRSQFAFGQSTSLTTEAPVEIQARTTVGYPGQVKQVVIPGSKVKALPIEERDQPIILRVVAVYPHGDQFRYDLEFIGLEPGQFDLSQYLVREDGASDGALTPIWVQVDSQLPPGQVLPSELAANQTGFTNLYLGSLVGGGILWLLGLFAILFGWRGWTGRPTPKSHTLSLADRLRPLVEQASRGELSQGDQADLERTLTAYWRKRLRLEHLPPARLLAELKSHEQARDLLQTLETWIHHPRHALPDRIEELLRPYLNEPEAEVSNGRK